MLRNASFLQIYLYIAFTQVYKNWYEVLVVTVFFHSIMFNGPFSTGADLSQPQPALGLERQVMNRGNFKAGTQGSVQPPRQDGVYPGFLDLPPSISWSQTVFLLVQI